MTRTEMELETAAVRLRARVGAGRYAGARDALAEYGVAVREAVFGLAPEDPGRSRLLRESLKLLEDVRRRTLANRAHAAARLARLPRPPRGYCEQGPARPNWVCLG